MSKQNLHTLSDKEIINLRSCGQLITPQEAEDYQKLLSQREELEHFSIIKFNQQAQAIANHLASTGRLLTQEEVEEYRALKAANDIWMNGKQAAEFLGCSQAMICKLASRGKLDFTMNGNRPVYSKIGLIRYREKYRCRPVLEDCCFSN